MNSTDPPARSTLRAAGMIGGLASLAMLIGVPAAQAAPAAGPQLSITLDNGRTSTSVGDTLDSTITVTNLGTTEVVGLSLTQTMPAGLVFGTADTDGVADGDGVGWTVDLAAGAEAVVRSSMTVSATPPDLLRLATVACAAVSADAPPIVCASDSDQLPAGAAADVARADETAAASAATLRWYVAGGAVLVAAAAALVVLLLRRRRRTHLARITTVVALLAVVAIGTGSTSTATFVAVPAGAAVTAALPLLVDTVPTRSELPPSGLTQPDPTHADPTQAADPSTQASSPEPGTQLASFTSALPSERAAIAVRTAMAQIGLPYVWGGNGPGAGDAGFDCSGLTTFAYAVAGVRLPRTAHTQYYAGPHLAADVALQPGDLVFYGTPARVHHVGMVIGEGRMVAAPTFGKPVRTSYYRWNGDDFLGSTRPAATGEPTTGRLPYVVSPAADATSALPSTPQAFLAPPAPPLPDPLPVPAQSVPPATEQPVVATTPAPLPVPTPDPEATTVPATTVPETTVPPTTAPPTTAPPGTSTPPAGTSPVPPTTTSPLRIRPTTTPPFRILGPSTTTDVTAPPTTTTSSW